jgi:hypothetical protein
VVSLPPTGLAPSGKAVLSFSFATVELPVRWARSWVFSAYAEVSQFSSNAKSLQAIFYG